MRDFEGKTDQPILREWIEYLITHEGLSFSGLERAIKKIQPQEVTFSRTAISNFMKLGDKKSNSIDELRKIWNYLGSNPIYAQHFPTQIRIKESENVSSPTNPLIALSEFFNPDDNNSYRKLREWLPGKYLMHHIDWGANKKEFHYNGTPFQHNRRILSGFKVCASLVEIRSIENGFEILETQSFTSKDGLPGFNTIIEGVLLPYGPHMIAFLKGQEAPSFKCMSLEELVPSEMQIIEIRGGVLSSNVLYKHLGTRFVCSRITSSRNPKFGLINYNEIDKNIFDYITSSDTYGIWCS